MIHSNKKVIVSVIYRSASQNNCELDSFLTNFDHLFSEINKHKTSLAVITDDLNARSPAWWTRDVHATEGSKLFSLTSSNGFFQLISEPTHIQANSSSCIDLIFTNQPNLSVNLGVHSFLHQNCHRQIVYSTFNLNIHYPLSYQRLVWNYKKVDSANIRKALDSVNFERLFDQKDINTQVITLNETILNVVRNYVPNKYITIDDKDPVMDE